MFIGIVVILVGIILVLKSLGLIAISSWGFIWGVVLIALGIKVMYGKRHKNVCNWFCCEHSDNHM